MSLFSVKELIKIFPISMDWLFRVLGGPCQYIKILQYYKLFLERYVSAKHFKIQWTLEQRRGDS